MVELITKIDEMTGEPIIEDRCALPQFCYENGYLFLGTDLGGDGIKIELVHEHEGAAAIILPPGTAEECARWLLRSLGQAYRGLPQELPDILRRIIRQKKLSRILKHGDKKKIEDALRFLRKK